MEPDGIHRYGVLLPHFGEYATRERILDGARRAETLGFDSVWVRDHIVFHPHGMEGQNRTHIDPVVTLAAVAGVTERVILGTASLVPHRHPIHTALLLSSLEHIAGAGRVIAGFGIGTFDHEFVAVGLGGIPRADLLREQVDIMRRLWAGESVDFHGEFYNFDQVDIHPSPAEQRSIGVWYCGSSPASVRRALDYCDGWMPGRITMGTFTKRMNQMRRLTEEAGRALPSVGAIPITSPGSSKESALERVNWREMLGAMSKGGYVELPKSGGWTTADDLEGALIAGPAEEIIAATRRYQSEGLDHIVYDLRFRFADWDECLVQLGEEVLPVLRREEARGAPVAAR